MMMMNGMPGGSYPVPGRGVRFKLSGLLHRKGHHALSHAHHGGLERRKAIAHALDPDGGRARMRIAWRVMVGVAAVIILKLFVVQVVLHSYYRKKIDIQAGGEYHVGVTRGVITDRTGRPLVISRMGSAISMSPKCFLRKNPKAWSDMRTICSILGLSAVSTWREAGHGEFMRLKRQASPAELEKIRGFLQRRNLSGIETEPLCLRAYPEGRMACQLLGVANDRGDGLEGLESKYDEFLRAEAEDLPVLRDNHGRLIFSNGGPVNEAQTGASLTLTIDVGIQRAAERELEQGMARVGAKWGCAIVMETATGEVLALANVPRYHPERFAAVPAEWRVNRAISTTFEPGSTFKLVTLAAALQDNFVKEDAVFDCEHGAYLIGDEVIHDTEPHGLLPVREMLVESSNIGFAKMGQKVGSERLYHWARRFGFGEFVKAGLAGDEKGILGKPRDLFSLSAMAFGQGIGVTAIQLAAAYGAIANGGILMRPWVVKEVRDYTGVVRLENRPQAVRRVVSKRVARTITSMLVGVVDRGTGRAAAIGGYRVAGKTGTAQISDGKVYKDEKIVTFIGFLPAEAPRLLVLVAMDRPKYGSGGGVAGPVFREIALAAIRQAGIPASTPGTVALNLGGEGAR